jgi:hypothetical protein
LAVCGLAGILLTWTACSDEGAVRPSAEAAAQSMVGVKIYTFDGDFASLFSEWRELGVNTVFASDELNKNPEFGRLARESGIRRFVILPVFYAPAALKQQPGLAAITDRGTPAQDDWVEFVCPTREDFRRAKIAEILQIVKDDHPDGISLDFIRFFAFWEKIYPDRTLDSIPDTCFDASCLRKFQQESGLRIPEGLGGVPETAQWIHANHRQEWARWKCGVIADWVREIGAKARELQPGLLVNLHAVPWRQGDFDGAIRSVIGQDFTLLAPLVDYLSPMCYFHMLKREPAWVHSVTAEMHERTGAPIVPSIQVGKAYREEELSPQDFREALEAALAPPSAGVAPWSWPALEKEPAKKKEFGALAGPRGKP